MKKIVFTILLVAFAALPTLAQDEFSFWKIAGNWRGTLEYQDYDLKKRVQLPTEVEIKPSVDGKTAEILTTYDDFGKVYKYPQIDRIDLAAMKYFEGSQEWMIESTDGGEIILRGHGRDGGNGVEPFRKTITFSADSLTILKETRTPWQFRNQLTLKRFSFNTEPEKTLSPEQLKEDFDILKKGLVTLHPGIYRYNTPEEMEKHFAELEARLNIPLPEGEFFKLVSQLTSKIRCGHTFANPYNQEENLRNRLFNRKFYLPFYFRIINGKMIITENASSKNLARGSEILSINGVPVKEIIEKLLTVTKSDGRNTLAHRLDSIGLHRFEAERYAFFDWYFPLFFPLKDDVFSIEAIDFAAKKKIDFQALAMTRNERTAEMEKRYGKAPTYDDGWKFQIQYDSTAYLKIDNSITWRLKMIDYKQFLADAFAELRAKNIQNLIIDLRGNGGGDTSIGFELAKYLAKEKLPVYLESRRLVRNVAPQIVLAKYLDTYSAELKTALQNGIPENMYRKTENGYFEILPNENLTNFPPVVPDKNNFRGRTYIIADASNASSTFQFLNYVRENKLAIIAGQTTGGNKQGINGGTYLFLKLPHSQIEIDIPVFYSAPLKPQKDESIIPDFPLKQRTEDIGNNFDREVFIVKELIVKS